MSDIMTFSHGLGAAAFFIIALVFFFHQQTRKNAPWVIIACLFTGFWAFLASFYGYGLIVNYQWVALAEVYQDGSWCFALTQMILNTPTQSKKIRKHNFLLSGILLVGLTILATNALISSQNWINGFQKSTIQFDFIGHLILSVFGLVLIEKLYSRVKSTKKRAIKHFCIGMGALFSYDFYMYAHAIMISDLDESMWAVRGAINLFVAPMLVISALRNESWELDIAPSRLLIFRSTVFISCGIYLLIMGSMGYVIENYGGSWGRALQVLFLFSAGLILFILLASEKARIYLKLLLARHVYRLYYDYREEWLRFNELLSNTNYDVPIGTRITIAFAGMVESPSGVLLVKERMKWNVHSTWKTLDLKGNEPLIFGDFSCETLTEVEYLDDHQKLQLASLNALVNDPWLLIPLQLSNEAFGLLVLEKPPVPVEINWEIRDLITTASKQAIVFLEHEQLSQKLSIAKQFESYHQVSAFMLHDIKNILSSVQLLIQNKGHVQDPRFIDTVFITLESVHVKLSKLQNQLNYRTVTTPERLCVGKILSELIKFYLSHSKTVEQLGSYSDSLVYVRVDPTEFKNVLMHLIDNAFEASKTNQTVYIGVTQEKHFIKVLVEDHGIGMSHDFVSNHLFKPFVSTKGQKGMGIGAFQVKSFAERAGGELDVFSTPGSGTRFILTLPEVDSSSIDTILKMNEG